jgi:hypothetical protein
MFDFDNADIEGRNLHSFFPYNTAYWEPCIMIDHSDWNSNSCRRLLTDVSSGLVVVQLLVQRNDLDIIGMVRCAFHSVLYIQCFTFSFGASSVIAFLIVADRSYIRDWNLQIQGRTKATETLHYSAKPRVRQWFEEGCRASSNNSLLWNFSDPTTTSITA